MDRVLAKNILATITYYDVLSYPMTAFEIWKCMIRASSDYSDRVWSLRDVYDCLAQKDIMQYIEQENGIYYLQGRESLVGERRRREVVSRKKMKKVRKISALLQFSPFVRMICVTGRLSYNNCQKESDLDLLIVYKSGHIWSGRFFLTIFSHVLGVRRYGEKTSDRACLNYHITTTSLRVPTRDLFAAHEYSFILPIFDAQNYYEKFCVENDWIRQYKPHYDGKIKKYLGVKNDTVLHKNVRGLGEFVLGDRGMEQRLRALQSKKIMNNPKTQIEGAVILHSDEHLVFLPKPHGPEVFEAYKKRLDALEIHF